MQSPGINFFNLNMYKLSCTEHVKKLAKYFTEESISKIPKLPIQKNNTDCI